MVCIDAFDSRWPVVANVGNGVWRGRAIRIFDRIVSNSNSIFLFGPRSHCNDLEYKTIDSHENPLIHLFLVGCCLVTVQSLTDMPHHRGHLILKSLVFLVYWSQWWIIKVVPAKWALPIVANPDKLPTKMKLIHPYSRQSFGLQIENHEYLAMQFH